MCAHTLRAPLRISVSTRVSNWIWITIAEIDLENRAWRRQPQLNYRCIEWGRCADHNQHEQTCWAHKAGEQEAGRFLPPQRPINRVKLKRGILLTPARRDYSCRSARSADCITQSTSHFCPVPVSVLGIQLCLAIKLRFSLHGDSNKSL